MKKIAVIAILMVVLATFTAFAAKARNFENCGPNCCSGSCDRSSACSQCYIYDCIIGGQPQLLDCGMGC
jgi:hypothetical protein